MIILVTLLFSQVIVCHSSQKLDVNDQQPGNHLTSLNVKKIPAFLLEKLKAQRSSSNLEDQFVKVNSEEIADSVNRKPKSLAFYPYFFPQLMPFAPPSGYYSPQNKENENPYSNEWLSRTEPFKRNQALLDSPTYYIRLPPNPYAFVPGVGYVSRPPSLSDPEVYESSKPETTAQTGNEIYHDPFYRLPINFVSNGKPTSVYQLSNDQPLAKPDSNFINLDKGPYLFNGKPNEIFLVAQIYNALYGDELNHFYP